MEELRKLEKMQRMVEFMESKGLAATSSSSNNSNRFLANIMLLLLSSEFLEEASLWLSQDIAPKEENSGFRQNVAGSALLSCNQMREYSLLQCYNEKVAMVGLDSMQKANSTLEDFLDKMNEKLLQTPTNGESVFGGKDEKAAQILVSYFSKDPIRPLVTLLKCKSLLTERIREELKHGEEYWALERKLCYALINKDEILVEDVMKAIHLKSFDYRVLNLLLYQLRGAKVEELHMEFLSTSEFLVEVSDDLYDYEDDVLENNFNILRMFVRIYGASTAPAMLAKCITEAEDKYKSLLESLDPPLSLSYQKRCAEATKEGGKVSEHPLGTWTIPTVIPDEELYRSKLKSDTL